MVKKVFRIPVTWTEYGVYYVRAENLKAAKEAVYDAELPTSEYLDDSFQIDDDSCGEATEPPEDILET
jgi:hypothetical protein